MGIINNCPVIELPLIGQRAEQFDAQKGPKGDKGDKGDTGPKGDPMTWDSMSPEERLELLDELSGHMGELTDEEIINCINSIVQKQHTINH